MDSKGKKNAYDAIALVSIISFELVVSTGIGAWVGSFLYKKSYLPQWGVIFTTILGFGAGLFWVMRFLKYYEKRSGSTNYEK